MAIIPEYQRQRLASSAVGTAGVDTSGQQMAKSIAGATSQVADAGISLAVKRQEAKDAAYAQKTLIQKDLEYDVKWREHRAANSQFRGDPTERVDAFRSMLEDDYQSTIDSMPAGNARTLVESNLMGIIGKKLNQESAYAEQNQGVLAYQDGIESVDLLKQKMSLVASEGNFALSDKKVMMAEYLRQGEKVVEVQSAVLAAPELAKLEKYMREELPKSYLATAIDTNPQEALGAIDGKWFDKLIPAEDRAAFRKNALSSFEKQKEVADLNYLAENVNSNKDAYEKYLDGTLTYNDVRAIPDARFAEKLNALRLKAKPFTASDKFNKYMDLYGQYTELVKGIGNDAKARQPLDKMIQFQNQVIDAIGEGEMDGESGRSLMKNLAIATGKKIKSTEGWGSDFKKMSEPYQMAYNTIRSEARKAKFPTSTQAGMLLEFDRQLAMAGPDPTPQRVNEAIRTAMTETLHRTNPSFVWANKDTTRVLTAGGDDIRAGAPTPKTAQKLQREYQIVFNKTRNRKEKLYPDGRREPLTNG